MALSVGFFGPGSASDVVISLKFFVTFPIESFGSICLLIFFHVFGLRFAAAEVQLLLYLVKQFRH